MSEVPLVRTCFCASSSVTLHSLFQEGKARPTSTSKGDKSILKHQVRLQTKFKTE